MRKGYLCLIAVVLLMSACKRKKSLPEGILPRKQMQEILWDLTTAGEFLNGFVYSRDTSVQQTSLSEAWYNKVYSLHHITREKFLQSYTYYQQHPELMREVLDTLAKREQPVPSLLEYSQKIVPDSVADKFLPPMQRRADSLRRVREKSRQANLERARLKAMKKK